MWLRRQGKHVSDEGKLFFRSTWSRFSTRLAPTYSMPTSAQWPAETMMTPSSMSTAQILTRYFLTMWEFLAVFHVLESRLFKKCSKYWVFCAIWWYDDHHLKVWWSSYEDLMTVTHCEDHIYCLQVFVWSMVVGSGDVTDAGQRQKWPEKLRRYARTKGNQEKTDRIIDIIDLIDII